CRLLRGPVQSVRHHRTEGAGRSSPTDGGAFRGSRNAPRQRPILHRIATECQGGIV
ncbi:MAG: hypothetical protein AVDCRST_MAG73-17, partial [uncultured Thermomicrobiales bacterium]